MTHKRIVTDPTIANGVPFIQGTSASVAEVLTHVASTVSEEILDQFPDLELADVKAAIQYAASLARQQVREPDEDYTLGEAIYNRASLANLDLKKILIVDDAEENRTLMQYMFMKGKFEGNFTLSMATNGKEALTKARNELPVLIISDIQMPVMTGLELLEALKADERTKNIAVILVTAHSRSAQYTSLGLDMGADDYIYRPFVLEEFMSRVRAVLRIRWAEAEIRRQTQALARYNKGLEIVNDLALAVNSSLDLQDIFASSMQKISNLLDAEAVSLFLLHEESQQLVANISSRIGKHVSISCDFSYEEKVTAEVIQEQVPVIVSNIFNNHQVRLGIDFARDVDTIQCIPMISRDQIIGAIATVSKRKRAFGNDDWVLLHSAAGIIAVAVENTRLLKNTQQQVDDLIALNEIGRTLTSTLNLEQILKLTTLVVQKSLQAEATSLWLLDETAQELILIAPSGPGADIVTGFRLSIYDGIAGYVTRTGEPYISTDLSKDKIHFKGVDKMTNYESGSILSVPIQVKNRVIGAMHALHQNTNWFDQNHLRLLSSVASSISIAVENARLFSEIQDFNRHLEQMVAERTEELAEEKDKIEAILTSMADGLLVLDAENCILTTNVVAEKMLNFHLSESIGQSINSEQLKNPIWRCINDIANTTESAASASVDVPITQETTLSIQALAAKVRNEAGQVIGTVIVLHDITALKEVESMKARFMAGVTHELKTPLSIIQFYCANLLTYHDRLPKEKIYELLNSIQDQVILLRQFIEDILQLSRLDGGIADTEHQAVNLVGLIDQVIIDLSPLAKAKQIILDWQKPTQKMAVLADANQLKQVIRNLVDNAIKYTSNGGFVKVRTFSALIKDQSFAKIQVIDTGVGIPSEHQARVFERFYRVDSSHTIPGTGLGLSIIKEIVNAHGGNVQLESTPGKGSSFVVDLPLIK